MTYPTIIFQVSLCVLVIAQAVIIAIQNKEIKAIRETQNKLTKTFEEIICLNLEPIKIENASKYKGMKWGIF